MQIQSAEFVIGAVATADTPRDGLPEVALAGRSNVGKSSLINRLVKRRKLARTSSTPGKTQQLNYYLINGEFYLVDLPGFGFVRGGTALRAELGRLNESYLKKGASLRAVIQLVDVRRGPSEADLLLTDWLQTQGKPYLVAFTKVDKLSRNKRNQQLERMAATGKLAGAPFVLSSAVSGEGMEDIGKWIDDTLADRQAEPDEY